MTEKSRFAVSTVRKITIREAMLTRFAESALKGDTKSAAFLLQRYDAEETTYERFDEAPTREEQEIIDSYIQSYFRKSGASK